MQRMLALYVSCVPHRWGTQPYNDIDTSGRLPDADASCSECSSAVTRREPCMVTHDGVTGAAAGAAADEVGLPPGSVGGDAAGPILRFTAPMNVLPRPPAIRRYESSSKDFSCRCSVESWDRILAAHRTSSVHVQPGIVALSLVAAMTPTRSSGCQDKSHTFGRRRLLGHRHRQGLQADVRGSEVDDEGCRCNTLQFREPIIKDGM